MTSAYSLLQLSPGPQDVHSALHAIPGVKTVHGLLGPTDVIVFFEVADMAALLQTVGKIRAVKGVASLDTRIVLPM